MVLVWPGEGVALTVHFCCQGVGRVRRARGLRFRAVAWRTGRAGKRGYLARTARTKMVVTAGWIATLLDTLLMPQNAQTCAD